MLKCIYIYEVTLMHNEKSLIALKTEYGIDFYQDKVLDITSKVVFYFDLYDQKKMVNIISGDLSLVGLPNFDSFQVNQLISYVEIDNKLAEVEGKNNFIETLKKRIKHIQNELFLYIPVKQKEKPIWLYISFHVISEKNGLHKVILGRVIRVLEDTPDEITFYQKTYQDALTRLFTRETLKKHLSYLETTENSYGFYLDIDNFKKINDLYGHQKGDEFIIKIADHFISEWEHNVLYYRLGGDEFFVYVMDHSLEQVKNRALKLINDIENLTVEGKNVGVSCSIGIVKMSDSLKDYHLLLDIGDQTMYQAKKNGKGQISIFEN